MEMTKGTSRAKKRRRWIRKLSSWPKLERRSGKSGPTLKRATFRCPNVRAVRPARLIARSLRLPARFVLPGGSPHDFAYRSHAIGQPFAFGQPTLHRLSISIRGPHQLRHLQPALQRCQRLAQIVKRRTYLLHRFAFHIPFANWVSPVNSVPSFSGIIRPHVREPALRSMRTCSVWNHRGPECNLRRAPCESGTQAVCPAARDADRSVPACGANS